jgi:hypothetical protein
LTYTYQAGQKKESGSNAIGEVTITKSDMQFFSKLDNYLIWQVDVSWPSVNKNRAIHDASVVAHGDGD